jgi:Peptidase S24-like
MRSEVRRDSKAFRELVRSLLQEGVSVRFQAEGRSMFPVMVDGEIIQVDPPGSVSQGDVVLGHTSDQLFVHRVVDAESSLVSTQGDCCIERDSPGQVLGKVWVIRDEQTRPVAELTFSARVRRWVARWRGRF